MAKDDYFIQPQAELKGEGNGWYDCGESQAQCFVVEDKHGALESFPSKVKAQEWIDHLRYEDSLSLTPS
jgi:hypothetical protein